MHCRKVRTRYGPKSIWVNLGRLKPRFSSFRFRPKSRVPSFSKFKPKSRSYGAVDVATIPGFGEMQTYDLGEEFDADEIKEIKKDVNENISEAKSDLNSGNLDGVSSNVKEAAEKIDANNKKIERKQNQTLNTLKQLDKIISEQRKEGNEQMVNKAIAARKRLVDYNKFINEVNKGFSKDRTQIDNIQKRIERDNALMEAAKTKAALEAQRRRLARHLQDMGATSNSIFDASLSVASEDPMIEFPELFGGIL